jgi:ABC-2 type transport system ATP-binding protein
MPSNESAVLVCGLKKSFKNVEVLRGVDFEIPKGSTFALLGSNGAGKTTTIKILRTLLSPDGGSAAVCASTS